MIYYIPSVSVGVSIIQKKEQAESVLIQSAFTCSTSTKEIPEQHVKSVQI